MVTEKRRNVRVPTSLGVRVTRGNERVEGTTVDLSLAGALLRVTFATPTRVGERMSVEISLPTLARPLTADVEVRWVGLDHEFGTHFMTGFRAIETLAINQFLAKQREGKGR